MEKVTIKVNKETIESGNAELLLCEARDYVERSEEAKTRAAEIAQNEVNKAIKLCKCS